MNNEALLSEDFSGVITYLSDRKVVMRNAYGYADMANERENTLETKFATATAGKTFVACGIMKLIEDGKLFLNTQIGKVLDIYLGKVDRSVTVKELLTHTSGIPDYFYDTELGNFAELFNDFPSYRVRKPRDLLPMFINKPMDYDNYGQFTYINSGYTLLAMIIEAVSRMPFEEYLRKAVFEPCGMTNTGYFALDRLPANTAFSYIYDEENEDYYTNIYCTEVKGTGAGGAFTTALDMEKFWMGFDSEAFISKSSFQKMITPQVREGYYGLGFWLKNSSPLMQGSEPGISFVSLYDMPKKNMITIISNHGNNVWSVLDNIVEDEFY